MKLEVKDGNFQYVLGRNLFENLSFAVEDGEILAILGPNGVGKTTLLKCMTAMLKWRKGHTYLDDKPLNTMKPAEIWKQIGYVPQSRGGVFSYTVLEMVLMGRAPYLGSFSTPGKKDIQIAKEMLATVGITHLMDKSYSEISGGEMQLVLIARALASEPKILILDEPESHLDFKNQLLILNILESISKERGLSCIINTHYPGHALRIADKTLMLGKEGKHIFGKTEEIITEENLKKFFGVDVRMLSFDNKGVTMKTVVALSVAG